MSDCTKAEARDSGAWMAVMLITTMCIMTVAIFVIGGLGYGKDYFASREMETVREPDKPTKINNVPDASDCGIREITEEEYMSLEREVIRHPKFATFVDEMLDGNSITRDERLLLLEKQKEIKIRDAANSLRDVVNNHLEESGTGEGS